MLPKPLPRIAAFEKKAFGMFVHYGLYSLLGQGEWVKTLRRVPDETYRQAFLQFSAEHFDAERLARTARNAGIRYITLTTRHHDGFSLYDTKGLSDYDAPHAPHCGRDLIAEFVEGCRKYGITPFFYHTTLDWSQPSFEQDFDAYLDYLNESVRTLCTNYGEIGGLWFDGNWSKPDADWKEDRLYATIRKYQPNAMIINNTGLNARGALGNIELDSVTFERGNPQPINMDGAPKHLASEMCQIMNNHWGYASRDFNYKTPKNLIEDFCSCRKFGANFLLNVGPRADGSLAPMDEAMLEIVGKWVDTCGQMLYDARPCAITTDNPKDFVLKASDGNYYLFVHDLTICGDVNVMKEESMAKKIRLSGLTGSVKNAVWLDNGEALDVKKDGADWTIFASPYLYGEDLVVRVAKLSL